MPVHTGQNQYPLLPQVQEHQDPSRGMIFNIMRFSLRDGPGLRTTVFFKGCHLTCAWCHNPESQRGSRELVFHGERCLGCNSCMEACPEKALLLQGGAICRNEEKCQLCGACVEACPSLAREMIGQNYTASELMGEINKDFPFFQESGGGVTFSGGEPLKQLDFLHTILMACRERGIHTAVDTSGAVAYNNLDRINSYVDLYLYDIKLMDEKRHQRFTGISNREILTNLERLAGDGRKIVVRFPLIPGINDDEDNVDRMGRFVSALPGGPQVQILPYHDIGLEKYRLLGRDPQLDQIAPKNMEKLPALIKCLEDKGVKVIREQRWL